MTPQKKKIIILALIGIFIVIPVLVYLTYYTVVKPNEPTIKVTIDPITGEQIIDGGTTPERTQADSNEPVTGPVVYGFDSIAELYGDNKVFIAINDQFFKEVFSDNKIVKISPKDIVKKSINNPETGEGYVTVQFYVYLDENTTSKYMMDTTFHPDTGIVDVTLTKPSGEKITRQLDASN